MAINIKCNLLLKGGSGKLIFQFKLITHFSICSIVPVFHFRDHCNDIFIVTKFGAVGD